MNHAKKMVLLEPEALERLQQPVNSPSSDAVARLDQNMQSILNAPNLPDFEKWKLYNDQMQRYFQKMDQARQPVEVSLPEVPPSGSDDYSAGDAIRKVTIAAVPTTFQKKAGILYDLLRASNTVTWDAKGNVSIHGQAIAESSITDLISDALRERKDFNPAGCRLFMQALRELNVPITLIGNRKRWQQAQMGSGLQSVRSEALKKRTLKKKKKKTLKKTLRWEKLK